MILNSDALESWDTIWNGHKPFPFNEVSGFVPLGTNLLSNMAVVYMYFKNLKYESDRKDILKSREYVGKTFINIYKVLPMRLKFVRAYSILLEYFLQQKNYTPIDIKTLKPLWKMI